MFTTHSKTLWCNHRNSQVPRLRAPAVRPFVHYASHLTEVNSGPGHQKGIVTKRPLELLGASSKTQCGGLRLSEYHGGEAEDTKGWKASKKMEMKE